MKKIKFLFILFLVCISILVTSCGNEKSNNESSEDANRENKYVFTANEGGSITKIDAWTNHVVSTTAISGAVHNVQLSPSGAVLAATVVPSMTNEGAEAGKEEHAENEKGHEGMVMNGFAMFFDPESMKLIKQVEVGNHPAHVVFTHDGKYALVTNNEDDSVTIIDTSNYSIVQTIKTGKGPHGFRISVDDQLAYIANMGEDSVSVIDIINRKETKKIKVGSMPVTTGVTKDGKTSVVSIFAENTVAIIDLDTEEIEKIEVGKGPVQVYVGPDDQYVYVANQGSEESPSRSVSKIDLKTKRVVATIETGSGAHGLVTSSDGKTLYVTNMFEDTVSVVDSKSNKVIHTIQSGVKPNGITITP